ncbi:hypothetical protein [Pontibacter sp. H249]|uniref:hypothetical protein n=1 Tax=Pontibacter sp. H249 TaxID=3133420 RepID=UPI0030BA5B8B
MNLKSLAFIAILGATTFACQQNTEQQEATVQATAETKRPAPEFFVIPEDLVNKRVWICENATADVFHMKHDCPVLIACKGKGTFRNVTVPRAVEDYGRYNCQECAKDLDYIFDEDAVRIETGLGQP